MRLIDADALDLELTESMRCTMCCNPMHNEFGCDGNCMISNEGLLQAVCKSITDSIDRQKEIDVVNNKHGRWIKHDLVPRYTFYSCSLCDGHSQDQTDYCPHCGATMDGDSE